ncbi:MAG: acetoacetate decarboxylase family protein [Microthrixaceae bacterium]
MTDPSQTGPLTRPGDALGLPKLVLRYPTDPESIAALLPPGLDPTDDANVQINVYCAPVHGEPEYGISTKVPASYGGAEGAYSLGIGIDQESAIFVSRETNGQPKFPCEVRYHRMGDAVHASATHRGTTFLSFDGRPAGFGEVDGEERTDDEWWIKCSRAVGGGDGYDFAPHVVRVRTSGVRTHVERLEGDLVLRDSDWDPYTTLLPMRGPAVAELWHTRHTGRSIERMGPLDGTAFLPFSDTIGGSRWPGDRGAPRRPPAPFTRTAPPGGGR